MYGDDNTTWISREDRSEGDFGGERGREHTQEQSNEDAREL